MVESAGAHAVQTAVACPLDTTRACQVSESVGGAGTCQGPESMGARQDLHSPDNACNPFSVPF
ncbi:MAG: hypothetical protein GY696_16705 [Gammaproteobacteria bacterium]|nr:hypothetical protein [Gammaproteobacteria bacterium]